MPALGVRLPLLLAQRAVFKESAPQFKIRPTGYLGYLLNNNKPQVVSEKIDDKSGYIKDLKIRFKKRVTTGKSSTEDNCAVDAKPSYHEQTIPSTLFRRKSVFFDYSTIQAFTEDALRLQTLPNANTTSQNMITSVITEVIDHIQTEMNGLLGDINIDLLAAQVAAFGNNAVSGSNAARTINFALDGTENNLDSGITRMLNDAMYNEVSLNGASIVGSGLINNYIIQQNANAQSANQSGFNQSNLVLPKFYYDPYAAAAWGANQFGVFAKDAVQFINVCRFRGPKSRHLGNSELFTLKWPTIDSLGNANVSDLEFDIQIREIDCPSTIEINGEEEAVGRGVVVDIMCSYAQLNQPDDAYEADDVLFENNGSYRYVATNA